MISLEGKAQVIPQGNWPAGTLYRDLAPASPRQIDVPSDDEWRAIPDLQALWITTVGVRAARPRTAQVDAGGFAVPPPEGANECVRVGQPQEVDE